jgi:AmmeMemoRadiSam system protein B
MSNNIRKASHAGSWYSGSAKELNKQLDGWLNNAQLIHGPARAVIVPHAGYVYCGECAAYAYRQISPSVVQRVFILGPSHHVRLGGCALSSVGKYQTPFYDLVIDQEVYSELDASGAFERMSVGVDEDEHSLEMTLPYVAKVMEEFKNSFRIVPIMVGSLTPEKEAAYGRILAPYLADSTNLFVISSDFCHWGNRFRYTYYDETKGPIYQSIQSLDKLGMDIIERLSPAEFTEYLHKYGNTICGRHPIGVLLNAASNLPDSERKKINLRFLKYAQSNQCHSQSDSSVSYAAASLIAQ